MCAIAGVLRIGGSARDPEIERMISTLRHRGPDALQCLRSGPCALASARLAIIDLETGGQPMPNEDRSVWTVANAEIFNYVELRADLEALGHRFRTRSDTEVIVHAYEQFGERFVDRLNGQFAIALWDDRRRRLLLARDRVGIRPLFYAASGGHLLFASEIKGILAVAPELAVLDERGLAQVFTFWGTIADRTLFKGVRSLPAGHLLVVENGAERLVQYWDWVFPDEPGHAGLSLDEAAEQARALLEDSVRLQLRSDVPVGAYLSGGLDSCGIAALAREQGASRLRTFSIEFDDPEFDESRHQRLMAERLGTEHSTLRCTGRDIARAFPDLIRHTESPILRTAPAPLMLLSRQVHESGYKVVLTGEGADEVFAGYDLFKEGAIRRFWAREPRSRRRPLLLSRLYPYLQRSPVAHPSFAQQFFGRGLCELGDPFYAHRPRWTSTRGTWRLFSPQLHAALAGYAPEDDLAARLPARFPAWSPLARDQYVEAETLLEGYLLSSQGDRVAMAHAVETRVPYLDHRVIEFANALGPRCKLRGLTEKAVLRRALRGLVPPPILERVKQPYRAPDSRCFFEDGKPLPYVEALMSRQSVCGSGYFDAGAVRTLLEKCASGRMLRAADDMAFVGVLSTLLLHEQFITNSRGGNCNVGA